MGNNTRYQIPTQKNNIRLNLHTFFTFLFVLFANFIQAQSIENHSIKSTVPYVWEAGVFLGAGTIFGDIPKSNTEAIAAVQPAFGLSANYNLSSIFSVRGSIIYSTLKDTRPSTSNITVSYQQKLTDFSLSLYIEPLGNKRQANIGQFKKIISPYLFAGITGAYGQAEATYTIDETNTELVSLIQLDHLQRTEARVALALGGGLKYDLSRKLVLGIEVGIRPTVDDFLDGISHAGNRAKNDWYAFGGFTLHYRLGEPDADGDGIVDIEDVCPGAPGIARFKGCPDSDGDGIKNSKDDCPDIAGSKVLKGCPDKDKDGIADYLDKCPSTKGMMRLGGCPDKDWDYVIDSEDECPDVPGLIELKGCPKAIVIPEPETFIAVQEADIPLIEEEVVFSEKGVETNEITASEIAAFPEFESVHFNQGSNQFNTATYKALTEIAEVLKKYPNHILHISTHAELDKNGIVNQGIASKRVYSCFKYLLQKGIPRTQLVYYNYKKLPKSEEDLGKVAFKLKE